MTIEIKEKVFSAKKKKIKLVAIGQEGKWKREEHGGHQNVVEMKNLKIIKVQVCLDASRFIQ